MKKKPPDRQLIGLVALGLSAREIAARLRLPEEEVRAAVAEALRELGSR